MARNTLYIFAGASGCGKTTLLQRVVYVKKLCGPANKYTTRRKRATEYIDGIAVPDDAKHIKLYRMEKTCDIMYETNNYKYGFISNEIIAALEEKDIAIILSDIRALTVLKGKVRDAGFEVRAIYISSKMDSTSAFAKVWQSRLETPLDITKSYKKLQKEVTSFAKWINDDLWDHVPIEETIRRCEKIPKILPKSDEYLPRKEKIRLMYTRYVHNISLFDHVILNYSNVDDMVTQAENIIMANKGGQKRKRKRGPVVFIICAAPRSGKGTLMENLNIMGSSQIQITPKYTHNRLPDKKEDKRDGMITGNESLSRFNDMNNEPRWEWVFHKNVKYAIFVEDVKSRLCRGISQIFVSNFEQLERLKKDKELQNTLKDIKGRFVFVYLHRVRTPEEIELHLVSKPEKKEEVEKVYQSYIKNIVDIDHVIINPSYLTYKEDLHDQMMTLIELYDGKRA